MPAENIFIEWGGIDLVPGLTLSREVLIRRINEHLATKRLKLLGWEWGVHDGTLYLHFDDESEVVIPISIVDDDMNYIRNLSFRERMYFENLLERLLPIVDPRDWSP